MEASHEHNFVMLSGWILQQPIFSHKLYGENFYSAHLVVPRLSGVEDNIPITLGERILGGVMPTEGELLKITGQLRSYNLQHEHGSHLIITVFARTLEPYDDDDPYLNEIRLTGYICRPPNYRTTPFAREIADILLAVNRPYHKSDYLPAIVWGRNARFACGLSVGAKINITGRIQSRAYQKTVADGATISKTAYEVSAATLSVCEDG